ncbi:MAG: YjcZ family sporulation protein [bacterium]|nr:YjcZ family sporulation protein [bacterium]
MYYYGNSYGYGSSGNCCGVPATPCCGGGYAGYGNGYAIILVLFILLIIILGARNWN